MLHFLPRTTGLLATTMLSLVALSAQPLTTLRPGQLQTLTTEIPVNIVFVGYEQGGGPRDIKEADFRSQLPSNYSVQSRYKRFYGLQSELGLRYTYRYNIVYAPQAFEDAFFQYLGTTGIPYPVLSPYQALYNTQQKRSHTIPAAGGHRILDPVQVEQWLAINGNGIPTVNTREYTVFFINWYGRGDFQYHAYMKFNEPDPDTGFPFGTFFSRATIAWGGTAANDPVNTPAALSRVWFYDLSAGPEFWTANYDVDNADVGGNGVMDYRMPPVWEYGNLGAYRPFNDLSGDLGKITRYVALNLLFTSSPLYKPAISGPKLPTSLRVNVNTFDDFTVTQPSPTLVRTGLITSMLAPLQPLNTFTTTVEAQQLKGKVEDVIGCFYSGNSCYGNRLFGIAFGDLFLYFNSHLLQFLDGAADYEIPVFAFNTNGSGGLLGFADDNWSDGTQSYVFEFLSPSLRPLYGFTTTTIHEVGHHLGMSHPHDGYDSQQNFDYGSDDSTFFAASGDQSSTIMSYMDLDRSFSQFDQDNMARYLTAIYLNEANGILPRILKSPRAVFGSATIASADAAAAQAVTRLGQRQYAQAAQHAKDAYTKVLQAADQVNVRIEPQSWQADYKAKGRSPKFVDFYDRRRSELGQRVNR